MTDALEIGCWRKLGRCTGPRSECVWATGQREEDSTKDRMEA